MLKSVIGKGQKMPQEKIKILILDSDSAYARRLAAQLSRQRQIPCICYVAGHEHKAARYLSEAKAPDLLILADDFQVSQNLAKELKTLNIVKKQRVKSAFKTGFIYPGQKLAEIIQLLSRSLAQAAPGGISAKPLVVAFSFNARLRLQWINNFLREQASRGRPLYYLPLAPAYAVSLPLEFTPGPELSSLLLLLRTGASADYQGLGPCFEMQKGAYYALRCGGRAEDLLAAGAEHQKQILYLFRKFLRSRSENCIGIVELAQIPLRDLPLLLGLADLFVAEIPRGKDYASRAARREMDLIISGLAPSVHLKEMNPFEVQIPGQERLHA